MKNIHLLLSITLSCSLLTACDNTTSNQNREALETKANQDGTAPTEDKIPESPYMRMQTNVARLSTIQALQQKYPHISLTDEQKSCLMDEKNNAVYDEKLSPYNVLTESDIREADEFFSSDIGKRMEEIVYYYIHPQMYPAFKEPTDEEMEYLNKEMESVRDRPFMKKVYNANDQIDMTYEEAKALFEEIADIEMERCNINTSQISTNTHLDNSPSIAMMNKILQASTLMHLAQTNPDITEEQGACLMSKDGEATYHETSKQTLVDAVGVEGIQEADKFYESEVGQKVLKYTEQQEKLARGESIDGEPIIMTEEDQAKMVEMSQSEANQKLEAAMQESITPEKMKTLIEDFATKEKARCNIS